MIRCFDWLAGLKGKFLGLDKKFYHGKYLFTIDWAHPETNILDTEHSEIPQEHKCAHILELTNGNYAAQPNNRILWHVNSYTTDDNWPDYKVQTTYWDAEDSNMVTEDSDKMFYEMKEKTTSDLLREGFEEEKKMYEEEEKNKRTYLKYKEYAHDLSFENDGNKND